MIKGIGFRYIAREYLLSFLVAFLFFFALFLVNQMLVIFQKVLSKNVDLARALLLVVYALPAIIAISVPFASLVATIMSIGRIASDNELIAFQAGGKALSSVFFPILLFSVIGSAVSFTMNDYFLPAGTIRYVQLYTDLVYSHSELVLTPNGITRFDKASIVADAVSHGTADRLLVIDTDEKGNKRVISTHSGTLSRNDTQGGVVSLKLNTVQMLSLDSKNSDYQVARADSILYSILFKDVSSDVFDPTANEMSSIDVYDKIRQKESVVAEQQNRQLRELDYQKSDFLNSYALATGKFQTQQASLNKKVADINTSVLNLPQDWSIQNYWIEFWKKFSIPAACFTLVFLGFPAGILSRRSGRALGYGIGLVTAALFWGMLIGGQALGQQFRTLSPFWLMWAPNFLFFGIGVILLFVGARK